MEVEAVFAFQVLQGVYDGGANSDVNSFHFSGLPSSIIRFLVLGFNKAERTRVSPAVRSTTLAVGSLLVRTNRFDTLGEYIYNAPKSVREGIICPRHTPAAYIYTSVGVTSAFVFEQGLNFRRSSSQKQSVQCRLFRNVVLRPSAPSFSNDIATIFGRTICKSTK